MRISAILLVSISIALFSCKNGTSEKKEAFDETENYQKEEKVIKMQLPTIGLLAYDGVLMTEVTAPLDVFTKKDTTGKELFNVIVIAETDDTITNEEGLQIVPDYTFENSPKPNVLFVPSAYDMSAQVNNNEIIEFIQLKNKETAYTVSNCAGATLGYHPESGVKLLTVDGYAFKDLNKNSTLDAYEDWHLSADERATDLASKMSMEQIAGLMLYSGPISWAKEDHPNKSPIVAVKKYLERYEVVDFKVSIPF